MLFDEIEPGATYRHARGKTVTQLEGLLLTHLAMNTAQAHFNEDAMAGTELGGTVVFGGVVLAVVIGLATQDTAEDAVRELGLDAVRFKVPVRHGDTLYAYTEVLAKEPSGEVRFRHHGLNQDGVEVCGCERRVLLKRA